MLLPSELLPVQHLLLGITARDNEPDPRAGFRREAGPRFFGSDQIERGKPPKYYNAAFLVRSDGTTAGVYRKIHLVPFGEYVPLQRVLFFAAPLTEQVGTFAPGETPELLPVNGHPISVAAGLKGLEILGEHPEYYDHINGLGRQLYSGLQDLADDRRIPAWVEYVGSIGNVYFTTKDEIRNFRDTLSANTRRWWNWFIHCLGNNVLFGIPNTGERAFMCTEHTEEDVEWALEVADNAFAAIGKEARRHKEKAPTVQLQAVGEQAAVYGDAPTPPSVYRASRTA